MKTIIKNILPQWLYGLVANAYFRLKHSELIVSHQNYKYSDEHLKYVHLLESVNYMRVSQPMGVPQVFFEFGCHSGRTFSAVVNAAKYLDKKETEFYAFDSFEGLPETDIEEDGIFRTGSYCTSKSDFLRIVKQKTGLDLDNDHIIKGFYSESLTKELQARMPKVGMVHIDVDLYSSTMEVLEFIKPLLVVGTVLIFDDWYCFPPGANKGEMRAVKEFTEANPDFKLEEWKAYSTFGKSFFVSSLP
jgi:O-methyltransferase